MTPEERREANRRAAKNSRKRKAEDYKRIVTAYDSLHTKVEDLQKAIEASPSISGMDISGLRGYTVWLQDSVKRLTDIQTQLLTPDDLDLVPDFSATNEQEVQTLPPILEEEEVPASSESRPRFHKW